jgi:hypothetical protein
MSDDSHHGPVKLDIDASGFGSLTVGDTDISNAVGEVMIVARVGKPTVVSCQEANPGVRIEVGMPVLAYLAEGHSVTIRDTEQAALIALGWTPPPTGDPSAEKGAPR